MACSHLWPNTRCVTTCTQEDHECGPAALATVLHAAGVAATPEQLLDQVYLPGRQGSLQIELLAASRRNGLPAYPLKPTLDAVQREVAAGNPAQVLLDQGQRPEALQAITRAVAIGGARLPTYLELKSKLEGN